MESVKNILLIDWHPHHRRALALLLEQMSGTNLVASLAHPMDVLPQQKSYLQPVDLILLGNLHPQTCPDLLDWVQSLEQYWTGVKFLILGTPERYDRVRLQPAANIWWISRQVSTKRLRDKILQITEPETQNLSKHPGPNPELTALELKVWRAKLAHQEDKKAIKQLAIRETTYHAIVQNLADKLQAYTLFELQRKAISMGLL